MALRCHYLERRGDSEVMQFRLVMIAASALIVFSLSACDTQSTAATTHSAVDVANQAKESAKTVAKDTARRQLCTYVETAASNRTLSSDEIAGIKTSASVAEGAQVDQALVDAAREIAKTPMNSAPAPATLDAFVNSCERAST
jgi:hypothetical protein